MHPWLTPRPRPRRRSRTCRTPPPRAATFGGCRAGGERRAPPPPPARPRRRGHAICAWQRRCLAPPHPPAPAPDQGAHRRTGKPGRHVRQQAAWRGSTSRGACTDQRPAHRPGPAHPAPPRRPPPPPQRVRLDQAGHRCGGGPRGSDGRHVPRQVSTHRPAPTPRPAPRSRQPLPPRPRKAALQQHLHSTMQYGQPTPRPRITHVPWPRTQHVPAPGVEGCGCAARACGSQRQACHAPPPPHTHTQAPAPPCPPLPSGARGSAGHTLPRPCEA